MGEITMNSHEVVAGISRITWIQAKPVPYCVTEGGPFNFCLFPVVLSLIRYYYHLLG